MDADMASTDPERLTPPPLITAAARVRESFKALFSSRPVMPTWMDRLLLATLESR